MHPIAEMIAHHESAPRFSKAERERIRKYQPSGRSRPHPQEAMIRKMIMHKSNKKWYDDYFARLRGLERAAGL